MNVCICDPQTIAVSKKFGFTKFEKEEYQTLKEANRLIPDGSHVKLITNHGTLEEWKRQMEVLARQ
jgi:large subunit ribosomal protein L10e